MTFQYDKKDLLRALEVLKNGGVILYPTDTIWGLGCDATRQEAVDKIFRIKERSGTQSLIILVDSKAMLERYTGEIPEIASKLLDASAKPVTIIYPEGKNLAAGVCAADGSIGIRVCKEPFCRNLITSFGKPVISTSANISNQPPPGNFSEIDDLIISSVDYIVRYRQEDPAKYPSSRLIKVGREGTIKIIRE
jgi:L-threonylcarbamoyladenylate synthase